MTTMLEPLIHSPQLPRYLAELRGLLDAEQQRREDFYEWITEDHKAEFVNGAVLVHSPVKLRHAEAASQLFVLLRVHTQKHMLGLAGYKKLRSYAVGDLSLCNAMSC